MVAIQFSASVEKSAGDRIIGRLRSQNWRRVHCTAGAPVTVSTGDGFQHQGSAQTIQRRSACKKHGRGTATRTTIFSLRVNALIAMCFLNW